MTSINSNDIENRKSYEKVGRIYNAILHGRNQVSVEELLKTDGEINYCGSSSDLPKAPNLLHLAYSLGSIELFNLLLHNGADFTYKSEEDTTVVHRVIEDAADDFLHLKTTFQDVFIDSILSAHIQYKNFSNPCNKKGITHFHAACMTNNVTAVEFFLKNEVDVNQTIKLDSSILPAGTPLHLAVKYTCPDVVEILLKNGANIHSKNAAGFSPLHLIVKKKIEKFHINVESQLNRTLEIFINFVINNGDGDIEATDDYGFSKFHLTCILQDDFVVESVLKKVKDVNKSVNFDSPICPGFTPLHFAVFSNVRIFKLLLRNSANIEAKTAKGKTPFDLCLENYNSIDIRSILLVKQEWMNIILSDNETKLVDVVSTMEDVNDFATFLNRSSGPISTLFIPFDSLLWPGYTILHLAVVFARKISNPAVSYFEQKDNIEFIDECLKRGADVTKKNANGSTALHLAFYMRKVGIVEQFFNRHVKLENLCDNHNLSHFHIACATGHLKAVERFLSNGVKINDTILSSFKCQVALRDHMTPNYRNFFICPGSTALHMNVSTGNDEITKKLLKHGADVHAKDVNGFTPIHRLLSCKEFRPTEDVRNLLLSAKNLKNSLTHCGLSHLHIACYFGHIHAVKKLLKHGTDINAPLDYQFALNVKDYDEYFFDPYGNLQQPLSFLSDYGGYTPLHFALRSANYKIVSMLVEKNADLLKENHEGITSLNNLLLLERVDPFDKYYALLNKTTAIQTYLEQEYGITKLHLACFLEDSKLVKTLIDRGADVNAKVKSKCPIWQGYTPLHSTMKRSFENCWDKFNKTKKIIRLLAKHGANVTLADDNRNTPFHMIKLIYRHRDRLLQVSSLILVLFENLEDFNVNPTDSYGISLFHIACIIKSADIIEKFLKHNVNVNQPIGLFSDFHPGSTPLHLVIEMSDSLSHCLPEKKISIQTLQQIVDMLLENGASINAIDVFGNTPLHQVSLMTESLGIFIEKFIRNGADVNAVNFSGDTPLGKFLNSQSVTWEDIELFLKCGCDINSYNNISKEGYIRDWFIGNLIETSRILDINSKGRTIIHNIVSFNTRKFFYASKAEIIHQLTMKGCDVDHQDNEGKTALHLAVDIRNNRGILDLLRNGADMNVLDKSGKTAFAYCGECSEPPNKDYAWYEDSSFQMDYDNYFAHKIFATHVYKLKLCGQRVNEQNNQLQVEVLENLGPMKGKVMDRFHDEMNKTKNMFIGSTNLSLYEFLTAIDMNTIYMNMTNEKQLEVEEFFTNIKTHNFCEIDGLLKLKYNKTIGRIKLLEPALTSLNVLTKGNLPDLCSRKIISFLKNEDLKRLIASVTN